MRKAMLQGALLHYSVAEKQSFLLKQLSNNMYANRFSFVCQ